MTKISFEEKPTPEQIKLYEDGLKHFLQYQKAEIKVVLNELPIIIKTYWNQEHTKTDYHWIEYFLVKTPEIEFEMDNPYRDGIDGETLSKEYLWSDAYYIQDQIYKRLKKDPCLERGNSDLYWKLWDLRADQK